MMIRLHHVHKEFRSRQGTLQALDDVNLFIRRGEFVTIMGPSGSGKSTLLSIIGLLNSPSGGRLEIEGMDTYHLAERQKTRLRAEKFGFVFQFPSLVNTLTIRENVLLPIMLAGQARRTDWERADRLLEQVGLKEHANRRSHELSGGEQRRVALARALINNPDVILADEPTGALDEETADRILRLLHEYNGQGKTILIVTHDPDIAAYGDHTIRIHRGRIQNEQSAGGDQSATGQAD
jgi:ABC-type lipoprotein export system ATPase subunit